MNRSAFTPHDDEQVAKLESRIRRLEWQLAEERTKRLRDEPSEISERYHHMMPPAVLLLPTSLRELADEA